MTAHTEVGAYSMGLLDERDRRAFEDHLAGCESCTAELAELSPMAPLLKGVEPAEAATAAPDGTAGRQGGGADITRLIHRRATRQLQHRRWQAAAGAAAAAVLIGGGIGVGVAAASQHGSSGAPAVVVAGQLHSATDPGTGVAGTVGLQAKAWGTVVTLDLSKVHGPLECQAVAVSRNGERRVVMGWLVPAPGDGVPGHPAHLVIQGGTAISPGDLARIDIDVVNGRTLLSILV